MPEVPMPVADAVEYIDQFIKAQGVYNPAAIAALHYARRAVAENAQLRDEHERYRQHSITLNTIGYAIAEALGEAKDGVAHGNPEDQVRRLIAELETYRRDDQHIIDLRPDGWTIQHPMACRPDLFTCPVNHAAGDLDEMPALPGPGRYYCTLVDGDLKIGEAVARHG